MFRNNLFKNDFYTARLGLDSSQFKLVTIEKVMCIIVIKKKREQNCVHRSTKINNKKNNENHSFEKLSYCYS